MIEEKKDRIEKFHLGNIITDGNIIGIFSYYDMDFFWGGRDDCALKGYYSKKDDKICQTEMAGFNVFKFDFANDYEVKMFFAILKDRGFAVNPYTYMIESIEQVKAECEKPHTFDEAVAKFVRENIRLDYDGENVKLMMGKETVSQVKIK